MIRVLFVSQTSACFELENDAPYYAPQAYQVICNGEKAFEGDSNVFSLFGLKPDASYELTLQFMPKEEGVSPLPTETCSFHTKADVCAINVRDFGATGDGKTDDTCAIQTAIHFLPKGGRLYFPAGTYSTLPLALKSHITLEFAEGATLLGSTDRASYPVLPGEVKDMTTGEPICFGTFEGLSQPMNQGFVMAAYAEDITIIGPGTVDGNAQNTDFWTNFKDVPITRPRLFFFNRCENVCIHGITGCNSASWQFHPYFSKNVSFYQVTVKAPKVSPNTDAIDPEACDHVNIIGCRFSVGDDCIAVKSGKIELGKRYKQAADHHVIRNCLMEFGHGAVTLGSEIGAGVKNLEVSHCYFRQTDRGLRIKTRRGRGEDCVIDQVAFENIRMDGVLTPIVINMYYNCCDPDRHSEYVWSREKLPIDDRTPYLGSFAFRDLDCTDAQVAACYIDGLPEQPVGEVVMENVNVSFAEDAKPGIPAMEEFAKQRCRLGLFMDNVKSIRLKNVHLEGVDGEEVVADHYGSLVRE